MIKITFLGAAQCVTGSHHLLEADGVRLLLDCGLFQEREFTHRDWEPFPVDPATINAVILTHAHLDHCGYLPRLVKQGFKGRIYCTPPTAEITRLTLLDSAALQEEDAAFKKKRHLREKRVGRYPEEPLYTVNDAKNVIPRFQMHDYGEEWRVNGAIAGVFGNSSHILGASIVELKINSHGAVKTLVFTGDLGRVGNPLLDPPESLTSADWLVIESTYGNRVHEGHADALETLARVINETSQAGGKVLIPVFAIERVQEIMYHMIQLIAQKRIPRITTFLDSPLAIEITKIYMKFPRYFSPGAVDFFRSPEALAARTLFHATPTPDESKQINTHAGPAVIMAGSGMCTGGRIKHHLALNIGRPEATVLFAGYQARGTLGRAIIDRPQEVRIFGESYSVKARIERIDGFSGHADREELLSWVAASTRRPEKIFVVHGEKEAAEALAAGLRERIQAVTAVPALLSECLLQNQ
jgi:metallo-beta-lactamase family protein